jgi:hypothetical protein
MAVVIHSVWAAVLIAHEPVDRSSNSSSDFRCSARPSVTAGDRSRSAMSVSTIRRSDSCGSGRGAR